MEGMPLVSIGLPTYNGAKTLERSIQSVLQQKYTTWELIISDNASTDDTGLICRSYSQQDSRIHYHRQAENQGASNNFSAVLRLAQGEYFMWLADDDWLCEDFLIRCAALLQNDPDCALACGKVNYFQGETFAFQSKELSLTQNAASQRVLGYYKSVSDNGMMYSLMRRSLLNDPLLPRNIMGGDWLFMASMVFRGKLLVETETCLNRSLGGVSENIYKIAASLELTQFQAKHPYLAITIFVFQEIAWASPVYRSLSAPSRWKLAIKSAAVVWHRYGWLFYFSAVLIKFVALAQRFASEQTYHRMRVAFRKVIPK